MSIELAKYLETLLEVPLADKYDWLFSIITNPRYVNELMDVRKMHDIETVYTCIIINEMMPKLLLLDCGDRVGRTTQHIITCCD